MRIVHLQFEQVCQYSLLTLILRAVPSEMGSMNAVSDECFAIARDCLEIHQRCMIGVRSCKNDPALDVKYMNW